MTRLVEPTIIVNGTPLTAAMAMTVRVAVCSLLMQMREPHALGDDEHGRSMASLYDANASEVIRLMGAATAEAEPRHG